MVISINLDKNASFLLHKWPRTPKSEPSRVGITVWGYCHMSMDSISMCSNTLYMSNMDVGSSLRWLSASTTTLSHHFDSTSDPEPQNLSQVGWVSVQGWYCMPMDSISMCSITLDVSNMEVESSLRWLSTSIMTKMHPFDSTSDHVPQNLSQVGWV